MKRLFALDLGDVWIGTALSDPLLITCRPFETVKKQELFVFLEKTFAEYEIDTVVVGYPITVSGKESEQTKKTKAFKELLEQRFSEKTWVFEDERMTSSWAVDHQRDVQQKRRSKETKREEHSLAAAFILQMYMQKTPVR